LAWQASIAGAAAVMGSGAHSGARVGFRRCRCLRYNASGGFPDVRRSRGPGARRRSTLIAKELT
jgi:hypothetical protein